jgi:mannose-6-phosphate isomerase-like protein (cupin superfamily)
MTGAQGVQHAHDSRSKYPEIQHSRPDGHGTGRAERRLVRDQRLAHSLDREEIFVALSGRANVTLGGEFLEFGPGDVLVVPAGVSFSLAGAGGDGFEAVAVAPVGVRARFPGGEAFAPPWTE